jgi:hypothetical protein
LNVSVATPSENLLDKLLFHWMFLPNGGRDVARRMRST